MLILFKKSAGVRYALALDNLYIAISEKHNRHLATECTNMGNQSPGQVCPEAQRSIGAPT
jgi:hypothetical protein